ncbi:hypothetical protein GS483_19660 [Rhodococcus hoagii]|nr:hypothetical protein [Prescottella equi]
MKRNTMRKAFLAVASAGLLLGAVSPAIAETTETAPTANTAPIPGEATQDSDVSPRGFVRGQCGGGVRICNNVEFNSFNPFAHDPAYMSARLDGGIARVGHFQFFGPRGFEHSGVNRGWGPGEYDSFTGVIHGDSGDLWCARFWEGANGNWIDVTGPICVTG